jgi:hypothetical protein
MKNWLVSAALVLCACASGSGPYEDAASPFPAERGAAPPPPETGATQQAPPEGRGVGGFDFGAWRSAEPGAYAAAFETQVRARSAGRDRQAIERDLEANGFACETGARLDCRIEIMERQCAYDWYVVLEQGRSQPVAGYDVMCLGARP